MLEWVVSSQDAGSKLIAFLSRQMGNQYSSRHLKRAIENNCCQVNGRTERFASIHLGLGDHVRLLLEQLPIPIKLQEWDPSRLLYEDGELLIYNKPSGVTSDEQGILRILKPYNAHVRLVHRLDRETSGVLLLAKSALTFNFLVDQFKQFQVHKSYKAIVDGVLKKSEGIIENHLGKKWVYAGQAIWGAVKPEKGAYACTAWRRLKTGQQASLVLCFPKTGRTHQIRVHMAEMGHPILGDFHYCKQFHCSHRPPRCLLHAEEIKLPHPQTGKIMTIRAPLPEDFLKAQRVLFNT